MDSDDEFEKSAAGVNAEAALELDSGEYTPALCND